MVYLLVYTLLFNCVQLNTTKQCVYMIQSVILNQSILDSLETVYYK